MIVVRAHAQTRESDSNARPVGFYLKRRLLTCSCRVNIWTSFSLNVKVITPSLKKAKLQLRLILQVIVSAVIPFFICSPLLLYLLSVSSLRFASGLSAGLQPVPPSRSLSLPPRAALGQALPHAASLQCSSLSAFSSGRRTLGPLG